MHQNNASWLLDVRMASIKCESVCAQTLNLLIRLRPSERDENVSASTATDSPEGLSLVLLLVRFRFHRPGARRSRCLMIQMGWATD